MVGDAEFVDGGTISGYRRSAFRWTTTGGFTDLGGLEALFQSLATAISADGSVVAGQAAVTNGSRAFRWTQSGGMVAIGPLSGHAAAAATGVSADGRIVVGQTTKREILELLGPPDRIQRQYDGDVFVYAYVRRNATSITLEEPLFTNLTIFSYQKSQEKSDRMVVLFDRAGFVLGLGFRRGTEQLERF